MGKTNTQGFNDFRQVFIALEQGLEGFCNQIFSHEDYEQRVYY